MGMLHNKYDAVIMIARMTRPIMEINIKMINPLGSSKLGLFKNIACNYIISIGNFQPMIMFCIMQ